MKVSFRFRIFSPSPSSSSSSLLFIDSYVVVCREIAIDFYCTVWHFMPTSCNVYFHCLLACRQRQISDGADAYKNASYGFVCSMFGCDERVRHRLDGFFSILFCSLSPYEPHNMHKFVHILICQLPYTHTHTSRGIKPRQDEESVRFRTVQGSDSCSCAWVYILYMLNSLFKMRLLYVRLYCFIVKITFITSEAYASERASGRPNANMYRLKWA